MFQLGERRLSAMPAEPTIHIFEVHVQPYSSYNHAYSYIILSTFELYIILCSHSSFMASISTFKYSFSFQQQNLLIIQTH
jgi:hypothetical protein